MIPNHGRSSSSRLIIVLMGTVLMLAVAPWIVSVVFSPLRPPQLVETPTVYEITRTATVSPVPTETPTLTPTPTPLPTDTPVPPTPTPTPVVVSGSSPVALTIYTCPGERFQTNRQISRQTSFTIFGWTNQEGSIWLLVKDDPREPQEWVKEKGIEITPSDYQNYVPGRIACRIVQP